MQLCDGKSIPYGQNGHHLRYNFPIPHDCMSLIIVSNIPVFVNRARCSSVVRAFAHGAMGRRIDPLWCRPIELFLVPSNAPRLVQQRSWYGAYKRTIAANRKE